MFKVDSRSIWKGQPVIRISVCSWATTAKDIDHSAAAFIKAREKYYAILKNLKSTRFQHITI